MKVPGTRWQRVQTYAALGTLYNNVYKDKDGNLTFEDVDEILKTAGYLGLVWSPQIAVAASIPAWPLHVVEGAVLIGGGAAFVIGGTEGVEQYVDYIANPEDIHKDPEKVEAFIQANRIVQAAMTLGGSEVARAGVELITPHLPEIFKNRFLTGPYLPF